MLKIFSQVKGISGGKGGIYAKIAAQSSSPFLVGIMVIIAEIYVL